MSRAFTKEPDGDQADTDLPDKPQSGLPNYITTAGLTALKEKLAQLRQEHATLQSDPDALASKNRIKLLEQELRYLQQRVQSAIPIDPAAQPTDSIHFGATAQLLDADDREYAFTIVGEDEADPDQGKISWASPLARALMGKQVDDVVTWERPNGPLELEIKGFTYETAADRA